MALALRFAFSAAGTDTSKINVHLPYEPVGARPLLGDPANPALSAIQQAVRAP